MTKRFKHGWQPDVPDQRDFLLKFHAAEVPLSADISALCPLIYDQGELGSCTANALGGAVEYLQKKQDPNFNFENPSRLFIYYNERAIEHTIASDSGAQIRDGIKTLATKGVCPEALWPYDIARFTQKPPSLAFSKAKLLKALRYERIDNRFITNIQGSLASGNPVVFGFTVYESFESDVVAKTGILGLPGRHEKALGGHAVMAVGYDKLKKLIKVRNSWGMDWGQSGYFWMPDAYLTRPDLADDFWSLSQVS